ncbi:MAG: hypothetical protein HFJ60_07915 [Clostridia bacterium]|jgi:hypothetical protein|nr:hypothetical protein [Clostridia bacterium]
MDDAKMTVFLNEMRDENHISPFREDSEFIPYIKDGIYDINEYCGKKINYDMDLKARRLLKNYVLYADYKKLAEFKERYIADYDELQRKYYINSNIQ